MKNLRVFEYVNVAGTALSCFWFSILTAVSCIHEVWHIFLLLEVIEFIIFLLIFWDLVILKLRLRNHLLINNGVVKIILFTFEQNLLRFIK
jgi:hypothetical protein